MPQKKTVMLSAVCVVALSAVFAVSSIFYASAAARTKKKTDTQTGKTTSSVSSTSSAASQTTRATQPTRAALPDIASLSGKKVCWGQGTNYDDLNRPHDAVEAQKQYGALGGRFLINDGDRKTLCLTFDEGYENGYSAAILDTLKEKNVKAVFFITGDYAQREGDLVQRMIDEGHTVGNHTWKHYSMPEKPLDVSRGELQELHDYVKEHFQYEMHVMRPPKGEFSEQTLALASEMGYQTYLWSFAYKDWDPHSQGDKTASLQKLNDRLHPGAIYLLHAVSSTNAAILGDFIDSAQSQGYTFVLPA